MMFDETQVCGGFFGEAEKKSSISFPKNGGVLDLATDIFVILLMAEILHQLIGGFPIIYRVSYIPGGAGFQPSTVSAIF